MKASALAVCALFAALALSCGREQAAAPMGEPEAAERQEPPFKIVLLVPSNPAPAGAGLGGGSATGEGLTDGLTAGLAQGTATVLRHAGRLSAGSPAWERALELVGQEPYRALIALGAPLGTVGLFEALRERRPDILLVSLGYPDDPLAMQAAADLALTVDHEAKSAALARLAANFGAAGIAQLVVKGAERSWEAELRGAALARLAAERGLAYEQKELAQADMRKDIALVVAELVAAKPAGGEPVGAAGDTASAAVKRWVYTSDAPEMAEQLLYAALDVGEYYIEGAAPLFGVRYGGAANLDDLPRAFDSAALSRGAAGRAAFWPGEQTEVLGRALLSHVAASVAKPSLLRDAEALGKALRKSWPASAWLVEQYRDPDSKVRAKNHLILSSYAYVAGRGYIKF